VESNLTKRQKTKNKTKTKQNKKTQQKTPRRKEGKGRKRKKKKPSLPEILILQRNSKHSGSLPWKTIDHISISSHTMSSNST